MSVIAVTPTPTPERSRRRSVPGTPRLDWSQNAWIGPLLLSLLCGFLFFYGLPVGELYRTESLRAIIAAEFLRTGNWIVPTLYGEPLFTKPPGMYAAIALVSLPFGNVSEWTARLPSALAATITVFLIYGYFRRQFGRGAGLVAALILPLNVMWLDKATAAEIDMMQVAWVTASILCFLRALEIAEESSILAPATIIGFRVTLSNSFGAVELARRDVTLPNSAAALPIMPTPLVGSRRGAGEGFWWLAALLCVAGGVLTKWTAPAFFYGTAIPLLWWRGRLRLLFGRQHLVSAFLGAGICLAWIGVAIALTGWRPFFDTVSREALMRLLPSHHYRPYPLRETLLHPLKLLATNLPWTLFALLTLRRGFSEQWDERGRRLLQAMHCWIWPNVIFWSVIPEHAARHSFPIFPGIAGLAAMFWIAWLRSPKAFKIPIKPAPVLAGFLVLWLAAKLVFVHAVIPKRNLNREPHAKGEQVSSLVPPGNTLYLFRLKDEGIMFYYGRPVRRLAGPAQLPSSSEPVYCILDNNEWREWRTWRKPEVVREMKDEQGDPIVLVKLRAANR